MPTTLVSTTKSRFTNVQKRQVWQGQEWKVNVNLVTLSYDDAEDWKAWLLALNGPEGYFLMGDPQRTSPRGSAGGTPLVNGADQTGQVLVCDGATPSQTNWLRAGDYVQLGSSDTTTLHKVVQNVDSDSSGNVQIPLWPRVVTAPDDNAALTLNNCVGRFSLDSNEMPWTDRNDGMVDISFSATEYKV